MFIVINLFLCDTSTPSRRTHPGKLNTQVPFPSDPCNFTKFLVETTDLFWVWEVKNVRDGSKTSMVWAVLGHDTVSCKTAGLAPFSVLRLFVLGESPLVGLDDLLATWELELGTTKSFAGDLGVAWLDADGDNDLSDSNTSSSSDRLTVSTTHTGLQPICTSTRKHFVNTEDVERVGAHTDVVSILPGELGQVLVAGNAASFKSFRGKLLLLAGNEVDNVGELVNASALVTDIENADLGVGDTTAETRLDERLLVLETVTLCWPATHGEDLWERERRRGDE